MPDVRLEPMTEDQYAAYRLAGEEHLARGLVEAGASPAAARAEAAAQTAQLLPDGLATAGHHLWSARDADLDVGTVWLRIRDTPDGPQAFIFDFAVAEQVRRRGYGRAMIEAVEAECRARGVTSIGLHVFAGNSGAIGLYEQSGFEVTSHNMNKKL